MQGLDDGENVIYMGTFSKAIAPAIRASYMVLPKKLAKRYQQIGQTFSCAVSRIDQKVLTLFLTEGHFERHLNRMRNIYKEKHDLLIKEIKKLNSDIQIYGHGAGAHIIVRFPVSDQKSFKKIKTKRRDDLSALMVLYRRKTIERRIYFGVYENEKEDMIRGIEIIGEVLYSNKKWRTIICQKRKSNEIEEVTNEDEHKDVEHYCYLCRRPESVAGKMLELPNNIFICTDCMQRTLNSMGNGQFGFIDARNMDLDSMDITKMMNDMQSMQPKAEVKKKKKDKKKSQSLH